MAFIGLASLFFYAWWDIRFLALLLGSVVFNYFIGRRLAESASHRPLLILGIAGNLVCLGWFKYFNFFVGNLNLLLPTEITAQTIILPLGISFFTFQQIAYLVDAHKGETQESNFIEYMVFVTFFPQLIAGPIVHHKTMMPQFHDHPVRDYDWAKACMGLSLFAIGLFKKVMLADELARYGSPVFAAALAGNEISLLEGWAGSLSYTLQLYFDFSGYSDMAIGLGLLFGVRIPANFFSPYKATSVIEFWQRWHMTLSAFLKDYLYIPLGGNRAGRPRRYLNLMITMLLGGLWHGANWTFVVWGGLHGVYLIINHAWRKVFPDLLNATPFGRMVGWTITMLAIVVAWVLFRCESVPAAVEILAGMAGLNGMVLPDENGAIGALKSIKAFYLILGGMFIVLFAPNSLQIIAAAERTAERKWYSWSLSRRWLASTTALLSTTLYLIVYHINRISEFIYFQF
ncbi:MAG: MBOAT family protein [Alphaproteobacteria bacterium]|nr:MBOAT family protein [Alphaproteobacteria bacterium]